MLRLRQLTGLSQLGIELLQLIQSFRARPKIESVTTFYSQWQL